MNPFLHQGHVAEHTSSHRTTAPVPWLERNGRLAEFATDNSIDATRITDSIRKAPDHGRSKVEVPVQGTSDGSGRQTSTKIAHS